MSRLFLSPDVILSLKVSGIVQTLSNALIFFCFEVKNIFVMRLCLYRNSFYYLGPHPSRLQQSSWGYCHAAASFSHKVNKHLCSYAVIPEGPFEPEFYIGLDSIKSFVLKSVRPSFVDEAYPSSPSCLI